ncbi:MAG: protein-L-isoaspartate O-methyltransferase family protein, partial [Novosphingobium sp.]
MPAARRAVAYIDRAVPLGDGRALSPALTYGQMLEAAQTTREDKVLVISPNGYLAALAAQLSGSVARADSLADAKGGTFSLILVDGAAEVLPDSLASLLTDEGRIVTGLSDRGVTRLAIGRAVQGKVVATPLAEADFAILAEF